MSMTLIRHVELTGSETTIVLDAIPATYTDLYLLLSLRSDRSNNNSSLYLGMNGVATNQSSRTLQGNGSVVDSYAPAYIDLGQIAASTTTSNTFSNISVYIPNYTSSVAKSVSADGVNEDNVSEAYQTIIAGLWDSTAAITSLELVHINATNFVQYSSATLYGITAGSDGITAVS